MYRWAYQSQAQNGSEACSFLDYCSTAPCGDTMHISTTISKGQMHLAELTVCGHATWACATADISSALQHTMQLNMWRFTQGMQFHGITLLVAPIY